MKSVLSSLWCLEPYVPCGRAIPCTDCSLQNHLPNKRHIGKQDPYCAVTLNGETRRTKAIKRGGQHPDWDEEIRFTIYEDNDDILARTAKGDGNPPSPPPKDDKKARAIKGGKNMKLACYADDSREPDLIGECKVDLTEVLTKGETDGKSYYVHKPVGSVFIIRQIGSHS